MTMRWALLYFGRYMSHSANIVVIAEETSLPRSLERALNREEFEVRHIDLDTASSTEGVLDQADGVVVSARDIDPRQWTKLAHVLDNLESRNVASLVMLPEEHQARPVHLSRNDGLICMSTSDSAEEIWGRLSTIAAHRSVIRHLENELACFYRRQPHLAQHLGELDEEMRLASRLQRDFLPRTIPAVDSVSFEILFQPCSWVSGDLYDVFRLDEKTIGFYVVDVVGHGMPAALLTIFIKQALETKRIRGNVYELISPAESLGLLNENLVEQNLGHCQFATACYCILDTETRRLDVGLAGHPCPLLIRADRSIIELGEGGPLLGVFPEEDYSSASYQLEAGDRLLLYSDGLEDAIFQPTVHDGSRPHQAKFLKLLELAPKPMLAGIAEQLSILTPPAGLRDDVTAVAVQIESE